MFEEIIDEVIKYHNDFERNEIEEICSDYYNSIPVKIKEETKYKRLKKYIIKEFELDIVNIENNKNTQKEYCLDTIPKYLFNQKTKIVSSLIKIVNLNKNIEQTHLFQ